MSCYLWSRCGGACQLHTLHRVSSMNTLLTLVFAGNNYSIANESSTKNARIFFAQGCEVEPEMSSQES
jgi:hypothetical protein